MRKLLLTLTMAIPFLLLAAQSVSPADIGGCC